MHFVQNNETEVLKFKNKNYIEYYKVGKSKKSIFTFYTISLEQFIQLLRYLLFYLLKRTGFFMHGSVSIHNNKALLFLGPSGKGKSTIIGLLRNKALPFCDDSFIIRKIKSNYYCFQTPFLDKQSWVKKQSKGYLIKNIYILEQSKTVSIENTNQFDAKNILLGELVGNHTNIKHSTYALMKFLKNSKCISWLFFNLDSEEIIQTMGLMC